MDLINHELVDNQETIKFTNQEAIKLANQETIKLTNKLGVELKFSKALLVKGWLI